MDLASGLFSASRNVCLDALVDDFLVGFSQGEFHLPTCLEQRCKAFEVLVNNAPSDVVTR